MNLDMIDKLIKIPDEDLRTLFKPKQVRVLENLVNGKPLDRNQERYLRGSIRKKLNVISKIVQSREDDKLFFLLNGIENCYVTGYEALKHNGFGWYYSPRRIVVINTRLEGTFHVPGKIVELIRVRSIRNRSFTVDNGIRYATNEQILKDAEDLHDGSLVMECRSHLERYGDLFIPHHDRYTSDEYDRKIG